MTMTRGTSKVEAVRREPDPARLNDFLAQQVSLEFREQIEELRRVWEDVSFRPEAG